FLKRIGKAAREKGQVDRVLGALVNLLSLAYAHAYFLCYSNGLKDVAGCLGFGWSEPDASGLQSLVWRARWEAARDEAWKHKLLQYNLEDCLALKKVTELLASTDAASGVTAGGVPATGGGLPVARVEDIDRWASGWKWGPVNFAQAEFDEINRCAYFDYQRERVFTRTSMTIRKNSRDRKMGRQKLRATRSVTVSARKCPHCGGTSLTTTVPRGEAACPIPRVKRAFDLKVTPGGIRRQVTESRTCVHRCLGCGHDFIPASHERLDKHFHGLKSWAMYQHVAHRLSIEAVQ